MYCAERINNDTRWHKIFDHFLTFIIYNISKNLITQV